MKIHAPTKQADGLWKEDPVSRKVAALCGRVASDYDKPVYVDLFADQDNAKRVTCKKCLDKWFGIKRKRSVEVPNDPFMAAYFAEKADAAKEIKSKPLTPEQKEIAALRGVIRFMYRHLKPEGFLEQGRFVTAEQLADEMMKEIDKK